VTIQSGSPVGLPGYYWDKRLHNYVEQRTRRMVKRETVNGLLRQVADGSAGRLEGLAQAFAEGKLTGAQFYKAAQLEIKHATNACAALAKGGWDRMTLSDWGANGAYLRQQYQHLRDFARDIAAKLPSSAQLIARARSYADAAFGRFWHIRQTVERLRGRRTMRVRTRGDDRVCTTCRDYERQGWQPIGTFHVPVHIGCRCDEEYG